MADRLTEVARIGDTHGVAASLKMVISMEDVEYR
jgi:hypothetical protein